MRLIEARPLPTPADAERLVADLWQLTLARGIGLFLFGLSGRLMLGVHSRHEGIEAAAAALIADHCGGDIEPGWLIAEICEADPEVASLNVIPTDRHLAVESHTFGWQRTDPLRGTFLTLGSGAAGTLSGLAVGLRAVPDLGFLTSVGVFAAGAGSARAVALLAASMGGIGVRLRRPALQRRALRRMLGGALRRPASVRRVESVAAFWHPPFGELLGVAGGGRDEVLGGFLAAPGNP